MKIIVFSKSQSVHCRPLIYFSFSSHLFLFLFLSIISNSLLSFTRALVVTQPRQRAAFDFCSPGRRCRRLFTMSALSASAFGQEEESSSTNTPVRLVDIGANLLEERFTAGIYRGTFRHEPDLDCILQRAYDVGCRRIILTAGTLQESRQALTQAREWNANTNHVNPGIRFYSTVGVHPTRCQQEFIDQPAAQGTTANDVLQELYQIAQDGQTDGTVVAIGECGLDYDRLEFCAKAVQHEYFVQQLQIVAARTGLPLFLHNRSVGSDLYDLLQQHQSCWKSAGGVVHSFDDSAELATKFIKDLGLYIGLNGCSLRTEESLHVVRETLPVDRILLETDCPYCEVRATHPGHQHVQTKFDNAKAEKKFQRGFTVKNRQEPCHLIQIAEIVAAVKGAPLPALTETVYQNSIKLYGWTD